MRQIKFRAWDKERKEMRPIQLMDWSDWWVSTGHTWERENPLNYGERNSFRNESTDRHILMQFTGLTLDYQDVYEHDVLLVVAEDENGKEIGRETCIVDFDRQSFVFAPSLKHRGLTQDAVFKRYKAQFLRWELLGNIYENPELLERTENGPQAIDATESA